jgi:lipoate-protein ligase A
MHISKNRVLCHGTLLFNSDLKNLSSSLKSNKDHYTDKSIKSVPSKVTTISENLPESFTKLLFVEKLFQYVNENLESPKVSSLLNIETNEINRLVEEKYSVWDWIYGYSPKYLFRNQLNLNNKLVELELNVEKGLIKCINSDDRNIKSLFSGYLTNIRHDYASVKEACISGKLTEHFGNYSDEDFCKMFF